MTKIATCIMDVRGHASLVDAAVAYCKAHNVCLSCTRIGRVHTAARGWMPAVFIVQELQRVAEAIERDALAGGWTVFHIQGSPTEGTVQMYTKQLPVFKYTTEHSNVSQIIEFNGNVINVQV